MRKYSVKRVFVWILAVMALLMCLVGCEGEQPTTAVPGVSSTPTAQQPTTTNPTTKPTVPTTVPTTAPTVPTEPSQPTVPTQPTVPEDPNPIPEELRSNVYLRGKDAGYCEAMTGKMMVCVIFLDDTISAWDDTARENAVATIDKEIASLEKEAAAYGAELDAEVTYYSTKINLKFDQSDKKRTWAYAALKNIGFADAFYNQDLLESHYRVDNAPVVFVLNREGRAYASTSTGKSTFENVVLYSSELNALRHEMCHVFGAVDFYVPKETEEAAETYLSKSLMLLGAKGEVDEFTALLIGWTETVGPDAEAFLRATNHITQEYLQEQLAADQLTGYGTKEFDNGTYTGYMVSGVPHGEGTYTWNSGQTYTGNWENGQYSGQGTMTWPSGNTYTGAWKDGKQNGYGEMYTARNGQLYKGEFLNGQRSGQGTCTYSNGDVYTGQWKNGNPNGYGEMTYANGDVYKGNFSAGSIKGQGTMVWADGSTYTGNWKSGMQDGEGEMTYANGDRYVGEFLRGKRHGQGICYYVDGTVAEGTWENDQFVSASEEPETPDEEIPV